jgi:hypothetical protein
LPSAPEDEVDWVPMDVTPPGEVVHLAPLAAHGALRRSHRIVELQGNRSLGSYWA